MEHEPTRRPFGEALADLLREHDYTTSTGNVNWNAFVREVNLDYETVRKAVAGVRAPTPHVIEECSRALRVRPDYFVEYRLAQAQKQYDVREVGFEQALANLERAANDLRGR